MIKKIYVVFLIILTASCSSLDKGYNENLLDVDKKLISKLELIQNDLQMNSLTRLKESLDVSITERYAINKLSEYDLSKVKFYFTKPEILKNIGKNTIGLRFGEEVFYFNVEYKYLNGDWKITKFTERR
ncbi:hypothetical protein [Candidatus Cetobacterium colombiensis]|uniref:DUF4878 domain-containing protein n=1 Tax=Candidatus Cetobacterium colombiensis TaxID=3073100 RepID=A0ABU4WAD0_9FUSO|nr:hypothetical protein [Candidatus Cetobacterium colombiensis]MDX8336493.1 hypothetical protein [Candidatus Cetobacterium colombiensis]